MGMYSDMWEQQQTRASEDTDAESSGEHNKSASQSPHADTQAPQASTQQ